MAWKIISSNSNANWFGEADPSTKSLLTATEGFMVNIPSTSGGISTPLYKDTTAPHTLIDTNRTDPVIYNITNYFNVKASGDCPGIKLNYYNAIKYIDLYFDSSYTTIDPVTLYVMSSGNGINWLPVQSFNITTADVTNYSGYYGVKLTLNNVLQAQYIAIMSVTDFTCVSGTSHILVNFNSIEAYSTDQTFGLNGDTYNQVSTGNKYVNINGIWTLAYEAPKLPSILSGGSSVPPNPAGLADGSVYFVINEQA